MTKDDAIKAIEAKRVPEDQRVTIDRAMAGSYNRGLDHAIEAIRALPDAGWRDIESAPKDGTQILAWCVCRETGDAWIAADVAWWKPADHWIGVADGIVGPTHWIPLPPPPEKA